MVKNKKRTRDASASAGYDYWKDDYPVDYVSLYVDYDVTVIAGDYISKPVYQVELNPGEAGGRPIFIEMEKGDIFTLPDCSFTAPEGKVFDKWSEGVPGTKITITSATYIKALWKDKNAPPATTPSSDPVKDEVTVSGGVYKLNHKKLTATFIKPAKNTATKLTIKDTVKENGKTYKVTEIKAKACKGMKKLTTLTIGKNVTKIP